MEQIVNKTITLTLAGLNGNAFALIGAFSKQARREKWTAEEINAVTSAAMAGDYDHLLRTLMAHCEDDEEESE